MKKTIKKPEYVNMAACLVSQAVAGPVISFCLTAGTSVACSVISTVA